jgi:hypothetical protein
MRKATTNANKYLILTVLPLSWSARKIADEMDVSLYMAKRSKTLVLERGILSTPLQKLAPNKLEENTVRLVQDFYCDEELSRPCPGKRDFVKVNENGEKICKQRRLLMCNLKEAFAHFKQKHPNHKVGFSKFAELRPKECVLALDKHGSHSVCVCVYHQNIKLLFEPLKRMKIFDNSINSYKDILLKMMCTNGKIICNFIECEECPGIDELKNFWTNSFESQCIDEVKFKQWINSGSSK